MTTRSLHVATWSSSGNIAFALSEPAGTMQSPSQERCTSSQSFKRSHSSHFGSYSTKSFSMIHSNVGSTQFLFHLSLRISRPTLVGYRDSQHRVGRDGRTAWEVTLGAAPYAGEDKQIEEVHASQNQKDKAQFVAQHLNGLSRGGDHRAGLQRQRDKADVDQVKAHHQQVVD